MQVWGTVKDRSAAAREEEEEGEEKKREGQRRKESISTEDHPDSLVRR